VNDRFAPDQRSIQFAVNDIARSGLTVYDFKHELEPLPPIDGVPRYRIHYPTGYHQDRHDRAEAKYTGPKGVTPDLYIDDPQRFRSSKIKAVIEGVKKTVAFQAATGYPAAGVNGCFGAMLGSDDGEDGADSTQLRQELLDALDPGHTVIFCVDGDWQTNDNVAKAVATAALAFDEIGIAARFPDFGFAKNDDGTARRLGFDDWLVREHGTDRDKWPKHEDMLRKVLLLPQIPVAELEHTKRWALSKQDRFNRSHVDLSDRGNATLWLRQVGKNNVRHLTDSGEWVFWDPITSRWANHGKFPSEKANILSRHYYLRAERFAELAELVTDENKQDHLRNQAKQLHSQAVKCGSVDGRRRFLVDASSRMSIRCTQADFDRDPDVLAVQNGVLDLRTGTLRTEEQGDIILRRCRVSWPVDGAEPQGESAKRMRRFITEVTSLDHGKPTAERERWLQCRLGAALTGRNQLEALEVLTGSGANGKSVLSKVMQEALGEYATTIGAGVLLSSGSKRDPEAASPLMMMTIGKRIVFLSESGDTDYFDETKLKLLTGNDYIAARGMYQEGSRYNSTFTLVLLTNSVPSLSKLDRATIDRMSLFEFRCRWQREGAVVQEDDGLPSADTWYRDSAPHDMGALQWILWWLVQGCVGYWRERLPTKPADVQQQAEEYIEQQDTHMRWLTDPRSFVRLDPDAKANVGLVYQDYCAWCEREGLKHPGRTELLTTRLKQRFKGQVESDKSGGVRVYKGLRYEPSKF